MITSSKAMRRFMARVPLVGPVGRALKKTVYPARQQLTFQTSPQYWDDRYRLGGDSGAGSYGVLAQFKAKMLNEFVVRQNVRSVIEFGCGDGEQLASAKYPKYIGVDVSVEAVQMCRRKFRRDLTKQFWHTSDHEALLSTAELAISLDVIYHLVEDYAFNAYMERLVSSAERFICIYSSDFDEVTSGLHVRHRCFTEWMRRNAPSWNLTSKIANPYAYDSNRPDDTSWSDLYFFSRA